MAEEGVVNYPYSPDQLEICLNCDLWINDDKGHIPELGSCSITGKLRSNFSTCGEFIPLVLINLE